MEPSPGIQKVADMEELRASLSAKGYDLVGNADGSDSDDDPMPGRIPSIEPNEARERGKKAFEAGKYDKAIKIWQGGLKNILSALCAGPEAMSNTNLSELDLTLNLNVAMAYMKKGQFESADRSVDKALARRDSLPPHQVIKALYRKASAQRAMHKLEETLGTLKDMLEVEPTNAAALKMQQEVDREWTTQKKAQKNNFKKMFSKMAGEDQKEQESTRQRREEARRKSGVQWIADDVDSAAFELGDAPCAEGKDWGMALSRSVLWSLEQLAIDGNVCLPPEQTQAAAWFLGVSSTCEMRHLLPTILMARLPNISALELVLIGFLGDRDPENKMVPDAGADKLTQGDGACQRLAVGGRSVVIRAIKGTMQDALKKELKPVAKAIQASKEAAAASQSATATEATVVADQEGTQPVASASAEASTTAGYVAESSPAEAPPAAEEAASATQAHAEATAPSEPMLPSVCFIAHPQLHRYFTDFFPAISWLIENRIPTIIIGASEPDPSWKQDEALLRAYGANIVVSKRESPYPMCLPDNAQVKKCSHIIGFMGGKALDPDKLTRTKIDLLAQDYNCR